jgi:ATP-dependent Lhr-like helicase
MQHLGPVTNQELFDLLSVPPSAEQSNTASETITHSANPSRISPAAIDTSLLRLEATGAILRGHFRPSASGQQRSVTRTASGDIEWCDRRLLARIHHLTVATLRKQIEPVTAAQFMHWLLRWQHLAPGTSLRGEHGLQEALRQLQGFEIPASAWERHILARRVAAYDAAALDHLCLSGVAGWGRLSPHPATLEASVSDRRAAGWPVPDAATERRRRIVPTSVAPITFFLREDCAWMQSRPLDGAVERGFGASARLVLSALLRRGASFFAELQRITALDRLEVERGLWELVAAGFVTADAFDNLRGLISKARPTAVSSRGQRPRHTAGRWSLLCFADDSVGDTAADSATPDGKAPNESATPRTTSAGRAEATCWMLLARYGIVFRELLARETNLPLWRELQWAFRRLEAQGQIRGGRFVSGFVGEQFALPAAVESLRELRNVPVSHELVTISAADPLNLVGILVPGERIPAIGARSVSFRAGVYAPDASEAAPLQPPENSADDSSGCVARV